MRKGLSWLAIFVLALPVTPVSGFDNDVTRTTPESARTLQQRLRDMSREAALFLDGSPESELMWLHGVDRGQQGRTEDVTEVTRLRVRIRQIAPGTEITVVLRNGEQVRGELASATAEEFSLNVPHRTGQRTVKLRRTFRYEEVQNANIPEAKGWQAPEKIREFPMGKRIELLLFDGTMLKGKLTSLSAAAFAVELKTKEIRELSFDEVASVRPARMSGNLKVAIIIGATIGVLAVVGRALAPYLER